jgi:sialic acid synthase SpsE
MGKSLYAARPLAAGTILRREDLAIKSPGGNIGPSRLDDLIGARLLQPLAIDEPLTFEVIEGVAI